MIPTIVLVHGLVVEKGIEKALSIPLRALHLPKSRTNKELTRKSFLFLQHTTLTRSGWQRHAIALAGAPTNHSKNT